MKRLTTLLLVILLGAFLLPVYMGSGANAQTTEDICEGVEFTGANCNLDACPDPNNPSCPENEVGGVVETILNIFSAVVGVAAVIMIVFAGFRYITSGGDSGKISSAQTTIIYAIVGLVVVALAQVIVRFVLTEID